LLIKNHIIRQFLPTVLILTDRPILSVALNKNCLIGRFGTSAPGTAVKEGLIGP
jgi:hypothetical protein